MKRRTRERKVVKDEEKDERERGGDLAREARAKVRKTENMACSLWVGFSTPEIRPFPAHPAPAGHVKFWTRAQNHNYVPRCAVVFPPLFFFISFFGRSTCYVDLVSFVILTNHLHPSPTGTFSKLFWLRGPRRTRQERIIFFYS
jgi:hypothetical protein